jgi:hypothetical protein
MILQRQPLAEAAFGMGDAVRRREADGLEAFGTGQLSQALFQRLTVQKSIAAYTGAGVIPGIRSLNRVRKEGRLFTR